MTTETLVTDQNTSEVGAGAEGSNGAENKGAPAEGVKPAEGAKPAESTPVEYTDFKLPEGAKIDEEILGEFKGAAKELGLKQDGAQKLVDLGGKLTQKLGAQLAEQTKAQTKAWGESSRVDKEFGGEKFDANLAVAKKGLEAVGTPELTELLKESGLGNHPELIRVFYRIGKTVGEDAVEGGRPGGEAKSTADLLYGGTT